MIGLKTGAALLVGLLIIMAPASALAADVLIGNDQVDCTQAPDSAVCKQHTNKDNPLTGCPTHCGSGVLYDATNLIAFLGGAAAVIVIILGGFRFVTSGSDVSTSSRTDTDVETARRTIGGAVAGLVIIVLARYLILFVIGKL